MERLKGVSLCMIVRNEEKYLRQCLESVQNIVDEMIIVDTGSTDKTIEIAEEFNAKIEHYKWNGDFSEARNYSLKFPTKEWILLLDGDDEFSKNDHEKFINLINTSDKDGHFFKTLSYAGKKEDNNINYNLNIRLIKNNKGYIYTGKIHEQMANKNGNVDWGQFTIEDIKIYHYGYLSEVLLEKDKNNRNIKLIEEELKKNPDNKFHMYNLAVEYCSIGDVEKAYDLLEEVYKDLNVYMGYGPKLVMKRVLCLYQLQRIDEVLVAISEGLQLYPAFTDLEFLRGMIYKGMKKYTLAIDSFNKCITMGNPPPQIEVMNGCADMKPLNNLGEIYTCLNDYERAIKSFEGCLKINPNKYDYLYKICSLQKKLQPDDYAVKKSMEKYFNIEYGPNSKLLADIFMKEKIYEVAYYYINKSLDYQYDIQVELLLAQNLIYRKNYRSAYEIFNRLSKNEEYNLDSVRFMILIDILNENTKKAIKEVNKLINNEEYEKVYLDVLKLLYDKEAAIDFKSEILINEVFNILSDLIILREKEIYSIFAQKLNSINTRNFHLRLAKLYDDNGLKEESIKEVFKSVKQFDEINKVGVEILSNYI